MEESNDYYIIVDGRCSIWQPIMHVDALNMLNTYLTRIDDLANASMGFYRPLNAEGNPLEENEWRRKRKSDDDLLTSFRDYLKNNAKAVLDQVVEILEEKDLMTDVTL